MKEEKRRAKEEAKAKTKPKTLVAVGTEPGAHPKVEPEVHPEVAPARDSISSSSSSPLEDSSDEEGPAPGIGAVAVQPVRESAEQPATATVVVETTETVAVVTTETIRTRPIKVDLTEEVGSPGPAPILAPETDTAADEHKETKSTTATSATSTSSKGESRVKSWFKDRFSRPGHGGKDHKEDEPHSVQDDHEHGSQAMTAASPTDHQEQPIAVDPNPGPIGSGVTNLHDDRVLHPEVIPGSATVDDDNVHDARQSRPRRRSSSPAVSPLTEDEAEPLKAKALEPEHTQALDPSAAPAFAAPAATETRAGGNEGVAAGGDVMAGGLAPPPKTFATPISARTSGSPVRDSRFLENL